MLNVLLIREIYIHIYNITLIEERPLDNLGGRVSGMEGREDELLRKSCCYFSVEGEGFGERGYRLIGRGFGTFNIKGFDYAP